MMIEENKNDNELNIFADSLINLLLVRDNGQCMKYTFVRSIPDLEGTKYLGKNVTITLQELPESTPAMILMCAETFKFDDKEIQYNYGCIYSSGIDHGG